MVLPFLRVTELSLALIFSIPTASDEPIFLFRKSLTGELKLNFVTLHIISFTLPARKGYGQRCSRHLSYHM